MLKFNLDGFERVFPVSFKEVRTGSTDLDTSISMDREFPFDQVYSWAPLRNEWGL